MNDLWVLWRQECAINKLWLESIGNEAHIFSGGKANRVNWSLCAEDIKSPIKLRSGNWYADEALLLKWAPTLSDTLTLQSLFVFLFFSSFRSQMAPNVLCESLDWNKALPQTDYRHNHNVFLVLYETDQDESLYP